MSRTVLLLLGLGIAATADAGPRPSGRPPMTDETSPVRSQAQFATGAATVYPDTVFFGGTTWAPDSMRWEALRDSVWTFDSGVGSWINTGQLPGKPLGYHGGMEGWSGFSLYSGRGTFDRSSTCAISGAYSLWAGVDSTAAAARCYEAGQGYGNDWSITRNKSFLYPGSGSITLSYDYFVETEFWDSFYVIIDTTGDGSGDDVFLKSHLGTSGGHETLTLTTLSGRLPSTTRRIVIRFAVYSGNIASDEDGSFPSTCGHTVLDNVRLSGAVNDFSDFESGDDGWVPGLESLAGAGDLSHLADIGSLPPVQVSDPCAVSDSVLVFHDDTFRIPRTHNLALSPWIDLKRSGLAGRPGKFIQYDLYSEYFWWPNGDNQVVSIMVRSYPAPPCAEVQPQLREFDLGPWCSSTQPVVLDVSTLIDVDAEQVQIAIGVRNHRGLFSQSTDTPWIDNVRFGVYGVPPGGGSDAPESPVVSLVGANPNPLHSTTHIAFTLQSATHVTIGLFDVAGRRIRTLLDSSLPAGPGIATWDARDDSGLQVPSGLYIYRLTAGNVTVSGKLIVLR